jgi:OFA family oxalate/formate antiporter-like MFS transporter
LQAILFFSIGHVTNEYLFELFVLIIISCYGGGFSCMPAYLNDLFGKKYLSTIHGKILLAWGMAGIIGPLWMAHCKEATGSYITVLHLFGGMLILNIFMAWWLKEHQEVHKADTPAEA